MATMLVDSLEADWDPDRYHDTFTEELRDRIAAKGTGKKTETEEAEAPKGDVLDLMAALERSVEATRAKKRSGKSHGRQKPEERLVDPQTLAASTLRTACSPSRCEQARCLEWDLRRPAQFGKCHEAPAGRRARRPAKRTEPDPDAGPVCPRCLATSHGGAGGNRTLTLLPLRTCSGHVIPGHTRFLG